MAMIMTAGEGPKQPESRAKMVFTWKKDKHLPQAGPLMRGGIALHSPMKCKSDTTSDGSLGTIIWCQSWSAFNKCHYAICLAVEW